MRIQLIKMSTLKRASHLPKSKSSMAENTLRLVVVELDHVVFLFIIFARLRTAHECLVGDADLQSGVYCRLMTTLCKRSLFSWAPVPLRNSSRSQVVCKIPQRYQSPFVIIFCRQESTQVNTSFMFSPCHAHRYFVALSSARVHSTRQQ